MRYPVVVVVIALAACANQTNSVDGTVLGSTLSVSAVASARIARHNPAGDEYAEIVLSSSPGYCGDAASGARRANQTVLDIWVLNLMNATATLPTSTGRYDVVESSMTAKVFVRSYGPQCAVMDMVPSAVSGNVQLTAISGDTFTGTFDVTLTTQDHITGSFEPTPCPALENIRDGATVTCL